MKRKIVLTACLIFAMALVASPVLADFVTGHTDVTGVGYVNDTNPGSISSINNYNSVTYSTSSLTLGTTTKYDSDDDVATTGTGPGSHADNFNLGNAASGGTQAYLQTIFGSTDSWDTFFIFENGGNDSGTIQAIYADGSLGTPVSFAFGSTGLANKWGTTYLMVFETTSKAKGIQINSAGFDALSISAVPIPGAAWLLGSGVLALVGIRRKFKT